MFKEYADTVKREETPRGGCHNNKIQNAFNIQLLLLLLHVFPILRYYFWGWLVTVYPPQLTPSSAFLFPEEGEKS